MKILKHVCFFGYFLFVFASCNDETEHQTIRENLIEPYFALIQKNDFDSAYTNFTSDSYKSNNDFKTYVESYKKTFTQKGKIKQMTINNIRTLGQIGGDSEYEIETSMFFENEKYAIPVLYTVSKTTGGKYLIKSGWFHKKYGISNGFDGPF
ncbi:MAG: hypothetical protein ACK4NY_22235 [Spirosomataceae bacterium]